MRHPGRFWWPFVGSFAALFAGVDLWADGNDVEGDTFSESVRTLGLPDWAHRESAPHGEPAV